MEAAQQDLNSPAVAERAAEIRKLAEQPASWQSFAPSKTPYSSVLDGVVLDLPAHVLVVGDLRTLFVIGVCRGAPYRRLVVTKGEPLKLDEGTPDEIWPSPKDVWTLCRLFGFSGGVDGGNEPADWVWTQKSFGGHWGILVTQTLELHVGGSGEFGS